MAGVFALAEGTDNPCSTAVMILLQLSSAQCRSRHGHLFRLKTVVRDTHDLPIGLCKLGFLLGYKAGFGLDVIRMYCLRIPTCCEYRHECCCLASPTAVQRNSHSLDATRRSRKAAGSSRSFALRCVAFALRLQLVDGRRVDAFVADLHCSRVQRGAAPIVSNVSA